MTNNDNRNELENNELGRQNQNLSPDASATPAKENTPEQASTTENTSGFHIPERNAVPNGNVTPTEQAPHVQTPGQQTPPTGTTPHASQTPPVNPTSYNRPGYTSSPYSGANNQPPYQRKDANTTGISYNRDTNGNYSWGYNAPTQRQPQKKSSGGLAIFTAIICVAFLITATALTVTLISTNNNGRDVPDDAIVSTTPGTSNTVTIPEASSGNASDSEDSRPAIAPGTPADGSALTIAEIADKCKPFSVGIEITAVVNNGFFQTTSSGVGSGFIISKDGYIATNNHVVENATSIKVLLDDKREFEAEVVGRDAVTDLAVIKIDAEDLPTAELGDSDTVKVGDTAIAIGTPAGIEFAGTVTDGIISAINRDVEITNNYGQVIKTMTLIQTNATINPGNSGGPLINSRGQVIGINTLKLTSQYEGIGFSIPINSAVKIFNQLIEDGEVTDRGDSFVTGQGSIGITSYSDITPREAEYYDIPQGVLVIQINKNSSAAAAGLSRGDIIVAFEGTPVTSAAEINKAKQGYKAGDTVTITVHRDRVGEFDITFKLDMMEN